MDPLFRKDFESVGALRLATRKSLDDKTSGSPIEAQVAFIHGIVADPNEANKFANDPKGYILEHRILLDPDVVAWVSNAALFDISISPSSIEVLGSNTVQRLADIRRIVQRPGGTQANLVAAAAVVAAAAAVATLVITLVRTSSEADRLILVNPDRQFLPGGQQFVARDALQRPGAIRQQLSQLAKWT